MKKAAIQKLQPSFFVFPHRIFPFQGISFVKRSSEFRQKIRCVLPKHLMCLSYFGRSTCLLRPFNVLTSTDQRAYFGRSKTNSSDKKTSFTASKGKFERIKRKYRGVIRPVWREFGAAFPYEFCHFKQSSYLCIPFQKKQCGSMSATERTAAIPQSRI